MRNSVHIVFSPALRGLDCKLPPLVGIPPNSVVKLSQNNHAIYTLYQPSLDAGSNSRAELPLKLCELNGFVEGTGVVEPLMAVPECKMLSVYVSKLDWEIISNQANRLEEEFMNQIRVVWPGARLPLFYDKHNCVNLRVECGGIGVLAENSQLEVLLDTNNKQTGVQIEPERQYEWKQLKIIPAQLWRGGNINKVYLSSIDTLLCEQQSSKEAVAPDNRNGQEKNTGKGQAISAQQLNNRYMFRLLYDQKAEPLIPCDTTILPVRDQIAIIKAGTSIVTRHSSGQILVDVEELQPNQMQQNYYQQSGSLFKRYVPFQCSSDVKVNQQLESILYKMVESNHVYKQNKQQNQQQKQTCLDIQTIYLNELTILHWGINIQSVQTLRLVRTSRTKEEPSKKIEHLLNNLKDFNICVQVCQKQQDMGKIREFFINSILDQLANIQNLGNNDSWLNKSLQLIRIYSKMPYVLSGHEQSIAGYIHLMQGGQIIDDPITIIHSQENYKKQKGKQITEKQRGKVPSQQQSRTKISSQFVRTAREKLKKQLMSVTRIQNHYYSEQVQDTRLKVLALNRINNLLAKSRKSSIQHQIFQSLYRICYQQEIDNILAILNSYCSLRTPEREAYMEILPQDVHDQQATDSCRALMPILITSFANNGKTVMNNILRLQNYRTLYIDLSQFDDTSQTLADLSAYLEVVFQFYEGQLIFMDNLDSICYRIDNGDLHRAQERIASKLLLRKIGSLSKNYNKICIFTAKNEANLDEELSHYQCIRLKNPTRTTKEVIAHHYYLNTQGKPSIKGQQSLSAQIKQKMKQIISNSESMSFGQFSKYIISGHRQQSSIQKEGLALDFSKLAGMGQAKDTIRSIIEKPNRFSFIYKKLPIKLSRGMLLYGGSGTGKTAIGEALAGEFRMKFFSVKGSDILSKYIGGSEAAVRDIFEKAMSVSPSIIFFDQFESIVPRRNASNTGVTDRVVNQFLCYLDGVASVEGVYIMAASSRPQLIDPALLRPGRIDTHIFLDYPDTFERQQLFSLYSNSIKFQISLEELLQLTEGYSYSDLIGLIKQLRIKQSARIIKRNSNSLTQSSSPIDTEEFKLIDEEFLREVIKEYKISVGIHEQQKQRQKYLAFKRGDAIDISKQKTVLR